MNSATEYRTELVKALINNGIFRTERVKQAFLSVRRHQFINQWFTLGTSTGVPSWSSVSLDPKAPSASNLETIYSNRSLVTAVNGMIPVGSLSQPSLVARMLEELRIEEGMRILEVGTCSGYNAALLSELVTETGSVHTIENRADAAEAATRKLAEQGHQNVTVHSRDGFHGLPDFSPFDRIVATVGCSDISPHWIAQLSGDGGMLVPLQQGQTDYLLLLSRDESQPGCAYGHVVGRAGFMPIEGTMSWANPWRCLIPLTEEAVEIWRKPLPSCLPEINKNLSPLKDSKHSDFHFYLTLVAREMWHTTMTYGLADVSTGAKVTITADSVLATGPSNQASRESANRLFEKLTVIIQQWDILEQPAATDYEIQFTPKHLMASPSLVTRAPRWIIERVFHLELISL